MGEENRLDAGMSEASKILDTLCKVSRTSRPELDKIWQEVKANQAKLDACLGPHDFSIEYRKIGNFVRDYQCTKCSGHIQSGDKRWYERGLKHGKLA